MVHQGPGVEGIQRKLLDLAPQNDAQRWLKSTALQLSSDIAEVRWSAVEQTGSSIPWPFQPSWCFGSPVIFASFGLFAPTNGSVIVAMFVSALSVAAAIYLIVEMDQPYGGLIKISSSPVLAHRFGSDWPAIIVSLKYGSEPRRCKYSIRWVTAGPEIGSRRVRRVSW